MKGPEYMAVTAGEVVHIIKCIPVEIIVQQEEKYYADLTVIIKNTTYFFTPTTDIIKIQPATQPTLEYVNLASLATSGIFTKEDLEEPRERIMFPFKRTSL